MKQRFLALLLASCLCVTLGLAVRADFGSFSGDSDYGGSFDYDFGGGSDYDYDYDYDYGSGGSSVFYVDDLDYDSGMTINPTMVVIVVVILIGYMVVRRKIAASGGSGSHAGSGTMTAQAAMNPGAARTDESRLRPIAEYSGLDASFDEAEFREKLSNLYIQMQNSWTDRDIDPLRPYFTDALFSQMDRQIDQMKKAGRTNHVERITVLGVTLRGFFQQGGEDHIIAELQTRIVDYTVNDNDGSIVSGSDTIEKFMTYEWELTRTTGSATIQTSGTETVVCPNCGAPVDINASARCEYCDTVLRQETHDWAICAIKGISQISS